MYISSSRVPLIKGKLSPHPSGELTVDITKYRSIVGSLSYAGVATHLDIAQAVGAVEKF